MTMSKTRLRIRFTKCGDLRWISHRDLARVWERLLRRANLQLVFSQGFHPKPRISFPSALALGIDALDEIVELEIEGEFQLENIEVDIRRELPAGMELLELSSLAHGLGKAKVIGASYRVQVDDEQRQLLVSRIDALLKLNAIEISRDDKIVTCDPQDPNFELRVEGNYLHFSLPATAAGSMRPSEMLECLGLPTLLADGATLQRTRVHLLESALASTGADESN